MNQVKALLLFIQSCLTNLANDLSQIEAALALVGTVGGLLLAGLDPKSQVALIVGSGLTGVSILAAALPKLLSDAKRADGQALTFTSLSPPAVLDAAATHTPALIAALDELITAVRGGHVVADAERLVAGGLDLHTSAPRAVTSASVPPPVAPIVPQDSATVARQLAALATALPPTLPTA